MANRKRTKLSTGVYEDKFNTSIVISVQGKPKEFRKDEHGQPYKGKDREWLRKERDRRQQNAELHAEQEADKADSLAVDAKAYLKTLSGRTSDDAENLLQHWLNMFGDCKRQSLTALELRQHAATWTCAASTFNHRRQALISLYRAFDGKSGHNPARELPKRKEIMGAPKALSYDIINAALAAMPESQSRARLKLMAYTGLPQMQITKLAPDDWQGTRLRVTPRRKGSGAAGRWIPLSPEAVLAMQEFKRLKCWGAFSHSSLWKRWKAYGPKGTNPYSLRHSWITELYRRSNGDVLAVKNLALHSMLTQTERYAAAALDDRMAALVVPRKSVVVSFESERPHRQEIGGSSVSDDLLSLFSGEGRRCVAVIEVFIDESAKTLLSRPLYAVSGFIGTRDQWRRLAIRPLPHPSADRAAKAP